MEKSNEQIEVATPLISIIVPVYKVEKYLSRCIETILNQTYTNFEAIFVDDGSPDNCGNICDSYAAKDSRIIVLHQRNQGQAAARNNAVKMSKGDYITFIDSDDYVEPDYLDYLFRLLQKYNADVSIGGFCYLYEGNIPQNQAREENTVVMNACEALIRMNYNKGIGATAWAKLYKRELILNHPFPEGQIYEDLAVLYQIIGDCKSVAYGNKRIYYWVQRQNSTMRMAFDERQMAGMDAANAQVKYIQKRYPNALASAKYRHTAKAVELISVCFNSGKCKEVFHKLKDQMNIYAKEVIHDNKTKTTMKIRIIAIYMGFYPAWLIYKLHEYVKKRYIK